MADHALNRQASPFALPAGPALDPRKFRDPDLTAKGERRARVAIARLETLWINTGTLCNIACSTCYIESSPTNDALVYVRLPEVEPFLDEAAELGASVIGFTGGEPFMNPDIVAMLRAALDRGFEALVLTNAMRPMRRFEAALRALAAEAADRIVFRVSLDHHESGLHDAERGEGSWAKAVDGLAWLAGAGFRVAVAGRRLGEEHKDREDYARLFGRLGIQVDHLVLFPSMDAAADVPEISEACWDMIGLSPNQLMCASGRMVEKLKGAAKPHVVACTLLPFDGRFALGETLAGALEPVALNHPHCARFCALGGASCSG